jgi:hypothetical protein
MAKKTDKGNKIRQRDMTMELKNGVTHFEGRGRDQKSRNIVSL